jgi:hypothetical protein
MESTLQDTGMQQQSSPSGQRNDEANPDLAGIFSILNDILRKQEEAATKQVSFETKQAIQQMELDSLKAANESTEDIYRESTSAIFGSPTSNVSRRSPSSNLPSSNLPSSNLPFRQQYGNYNQRHQQSGLLQVQPRVQFVQPTHSGSPINSNQQFDNPMHQQNDQRRSSFAQREQQNLPSLWDGRRSTFAPNPSPNSHFTQSIIPSNASTATNKLKKLTFGNFFRWMIGMEKIINDYPHEEIFISKYVHTDVVEELAAYDMSNNITGIMAVHSGLIVMDNANMHHLLVVRCSPRSIAEFRFAFLENLTFLPIQHGYSLSLHEYDWSYRAILLYIKRIKDVYILLTSLGNDFVPAMKSRTGSIGMIELILNYPTTLNPPNNLIKQINGMVDQTQVKQCNNIYEFLTLIENKNAENYEQYEKIRLMSQLFTSSSCKTVADILETGKVTKPAYSPNNSNNSNPNNSNNSNQLRNLTVSQVYTNSPYIKNDYDFSDDTDVEPNLQTPDRSSNNSDIILNYSETLSNNYNYDDLYDNPNNLHAFTPTGGTNRDKLVCFSAFNLGTCANKAKGLPCEYVHDPAALRREWLNRAALLQKSPHAVKSGLGAPTTHPTTQILQNPNRPAGPFTSGAVRQLSNISSQVIDGFSPSSGGENKELFPPSDTVKATEQAEFERLSQYKYEPS